MTRVAVYDLRLSAGTGAPSWADEEPSGYMDLPTAWLRDHLRVDPDRLVAFPVVGDSMEPDLREDDIAFLDIDATEVLRDEDVDELPETAASFRSLSSISAKDRDAALAAGSLAYLLADWVGERFDLPKPDLLDLAGDTPEIAALSLREKWGLGEQPIKNMVQLLEAKGVRLFSMAENTMAVDAFSVWRRDIPYVFLNTMKTAEHSRHDAAHELGHLVLHRQGVSMSF